MAPNVDQSNYKRINILFLVNYFIFLYNYKSQINLKKAQTFKTTKMNTLSLSENQSSSQFSRQEDQTDVGNLQIEVNKQLDPEKASRIARNLAACIKISKNQKFQSYIRIVGKLIEKGYSKEVAKFSVILQSMMDGFCALARQIQHGSTCEFKVIFLLSAIAELIKQAPQLQISMKKRFLQSLFLIDSELLQVLPIKKDVLAVLGVLYQCISKHTFILKKFQLLKQFKKAVLQNYSLIEQQFSCRLFNKALYNLAIQGEPITPAELSKYSISKTLQKLLGKQQASIVFERIKLALNKLTAKKDTQDQIKRSEMVAQN